MTEYGPVRDGDETAFWRLVNYAFSPSEGPFDPDDVAAPNDVGDPRSLYDGDELVAGCRHYDLSVDLREHAVDTGGIGVLASDPGRRREGNVRRLLAASLAEYRDEGRRLALLWPFDYEFYGALGWATVSKLARWEVAPDALDGLAAATAPGGDAGFERLTAEDWRRLVPVRRADGADTDLLVRRSASWWREFVFDRWDRTPYVYAWVVDGDVRGYLVYTVAGEADDRVMTVREHAARDADARRQLFRFCRDHDSQVDRVRFYTLTGAVAGEGFDPHLHLDDPGAADATVSAGGMARLIDVAADLPAVVGPGSTRPRATSTSWSTTRSPTGTTAASASPSRAVADWTCDESTREATTSARRRRSDSASALSRRWSWALGRPNSWHVPARSTATRPRSRLWATVSRPGVRCSERTSEGHPGRDSAPPVTPCRRLGTHRRSRDGSAWDTR